jgi:nicotinate phosphoribosyltransferase
VPWVDDETAPLLTDLYELTMLRAYFDEGESMEGEAVFSLFVRHLPPTRRFLVACGLDDALSFLEHLHFGDTALREIAVLHLFPPSFLDRLADLRFTGDVWAVPEGTPVFSNEPLLEVRAPLPQAQFAESFLMNAIHLQTVLASKAARVVLAAAGRTVMDFGLRRMQGADAALKGPRAMFVAGVDATSNVLAGRMYGIPVAGTMGHSYIQAHRDELSAFHAFAGVFPRTILLVDTYDTLEGVDHVIQLAHELGPPFEAHGIRLDSGDLLELSKAARARLDRAGLQQLAIFASGGLDEHEIARLVSAGAPIDGFGVGTAMGVSADAPALELAYKLVSYAGEPKVKRSPGKELLPYQKQVFRLDDHDVLTRFGEARQGRPLLQPVMRAGRRLGPSEPLETIRARARDEIRRLPAELRTLSDEAPEYRVEISPALRGGYEAPSSWGS